MDPVKDEWKRLPLVRPGDRRKNLQKPQYHLWSRILVRLVAIKAAGI